MKFKVKSEKIAKEFGVKKGAIVDIPGQQAEKWIRLGWGTEHVAKEAKAEYETKELKIESETKSEDASDKG